MNLNITSLKLYVPAKDFGLSKRRLQNYYVKDWADNFMLVMGVKDIDAWHQRAVELFDGGTFPGMRVQPPEPVNDSVVLHVVDPSGVLLIFVQ